MSIEIREISRRFGNFQALDHVNLHVPDGELVALLGPSGSGKTTLLRIIGDLDFPDSGSVVFDGRESTKRKAQERGVGFVFQHYSLFRHMTVFENVAFAFTVKPRTARPSREQIRRKVQDLLSVTLFYAPGFY